MFQILRSSPGLMVSIVLMMGCALVCTIVGLLMARAGASLRPVYWFAGFFLLITGPQFAGHLYFTIAALKAEAPRTAAFEHLASHADPSTRQAAAKMLFGPDSDAQLVTDARNILGGALAQAGVAQFSTLPNGDTVLLARFQSYSAAEKGWVAYLRDSGLNQLGGAGDSQRGYAVNRPVGDRAYVLHMGNTVGVWTGATDAAIRQRMESGGFKVPRRAPLAASPAKPAQVVKQPAPDRPVSTLVFAAAAGIVLYLFVVVAYFFKGAAWAGTYRARPGVVAVASAELAAQIEAINSLDVPFRIERGPQPDEYSVTWRYADAKWIDLARAHGMRRTFRIRLQLDERRRTVRATDYAASFDWSAGRGGAGIEWKALLGIAFFQYERQRVFGLQLDEQGRFKPELSYSYTFNLNEMKSPLIEAVTRAGWNWRPAIWQGPAWLRWLTA